MSETSIVSSSTLPLRPTISRTRLLPSASMSRCTTRSMALATVGTTNLLETFSPASNGNVQSFMTASRAEFAWIDASPGKPLLSAMSMSRLSASRTSPTRSARPHSQSLFDQPTQRDLTGAFKVRLTGLHRDDVAQREVELEHLLDRHHSFARAHGLCKTAQERGLPPRSLRSRSRSGRRRWRHRGSLRPAVGGSQERRVPGGRGFATNLRMLMAQWARVTLGMTTCRRDPSGSRASTNGVLISSLGRC